MNVYETTKERIRYAYEAYDNVLVGCSGGKDSCLMLEITIQVARELDLLPVKTFFYDIEVVEPETEALMKRYKERSHEIELHWTCMQSVHKNACSLESPFWISWDESNKNKWFREKPTEAIDSFSAAPKYWHRSSEIPWLFTPSQGTTIVFRGFRIQESVRRRHLITSQRHREYDSWISCAATTYDFYDYHTDPTFHTTFSKKFNHIVSAQPIWDWKTEDVWLAYKEFEWDYNRAYDRLTLAGVGLSKQRISNPYGAEGALNLKRWKQCYPELWDKFLDRVPGVHQAYLYGLKDSNYYSDDLDFRAMTLHKIKQLPYHQAVKMTDIVNRAVLYHQGKTNRMLHNHLSDPLSNMCFRKLFNVVVKNDYSGRYLEQEKQKKPDILDELGISLTEAGKMKDTELTEIWNKYLDG